MIRRGADTGGCPPDQRSSLEAARATHPRDLGLYEGAVPARTWKPGKVWVARDGIFPKSAKCLSSHAPFESALESLAHLHLSTDFRVRTYVCQPPPLHYWMPSSDGGQDKREYTPDFVALTRDDRLLVIDAKSACYVAHRAWRAREPFIRSAYRNDHNADFIIWTERDLLAEPRLSNARTLYRHRHAPADLHCDIALLRHLERRRGISNIGTLCDELSDELTCDASEVFGAIMRSALDGQIILDPGARYNRNTEVRLGGPAQ
jgi:hypothetical protein